MKFTRTVARCLEQTPHPHRRPARPGTNATVAQACLLSRRRFGYLRRRGGKIIRSARERPSMSATISTRLPRRRLLATVARVPLLAAASQLPFPLAALAQVPEDPTADALLTYAGTIPTLSGMIFAPVVEAHRVFAQSEL